MAGCYPVCLWRDAILFVYVGVVSRLFMPGWYRVYAGMVSCLCRVVILFMVGWYPVYIGMVFCLCRDRILFMSVCYPACLWRDGILFVYGVMVSCLLMWG